MMAIDDLDTLYKYPNSIQVESENSSLESIIAKTAIALFEFTVVDKFGYIRYITDSYARRLGSNGQLALGQKVEAIIPHTKFYDTLSGVVHINDIFAPDDSGSTLVCSRLPVRDQFNSIIGAIAITGSLHTQSTIDELRQKLQELQKANFLYISQLNGLEQSSSSMSNIIGSSPKILEIKQTILRVANSRLPILLTGESGCGKEVFANAIHAASNRRDMPFIKVNCAALPKDLMESEMFGYESGSFTGAARSGRKGMFESANNGTILLDEVEALPLEMQAKLLRVLQEYEVRRIGSSHSIPLDFRLICCSNQDLYQLVEQGKFREDFFYRINTMEIEIPPLRERLEDIPALCNEFIQKVNKRYKLSISGITESALKLLCSYHWPGNVRELEHTIEQACIMSDDEMLTAAHFRSVEAKSARRGAPAAPSEAKPFFQAKATSEKDSILAALEQCGGNRSQAAKLLGISRSLLYVKLQKFGIA